MQLRALRTTIPRTVGLISASHPSRKLCLITSEQYQNVNNWPSRRFLLVFQAVNSKRPQRNLRVRNCGDECREQEALGRRRCQSSGEAQRYPAMAGDRRPELDDAEEEDLMAKRHLLRTTITSNRHAGDELPCTCNYSGSTGLWAVRQHARACIVHTQAHTAPGPTSDRGRTSMQMHHILTSGYSGEWHRGKLDCDCEVNHLN